MEDYFGIITMLSAVLGLFLLFIGIIWAVIEVFIIIARYRIFEKAGKSGWKAIIPFYNKWVLIEITGLKSWIFWFIAAPGILTILGLGVTFPLAALLSLCGLFIVHYNLAIKFNKEPVLYSLGLTILPIIFYPILAFKSSNIFEDHPVSEYGPFKESVLAKEEVKTSNKKADNNFCKNCGNKITGGKFCSKCGKKL